LIKQIDRSINEAAADGAYDTKDSYRVFNNKGARPIIPPRKGATIRKDPDLIIRNFAIEYIRRLGSYEEAKKAWKKESGYHIRSIAENAMFRMKQIFSPGLKARKTTTQETELKVRIAALNKMTFWGMPKSIKTG
jgi:hypothetical protein